MTQVETVKTYAARRRLKIGTEYREGPRFKNDPVTVEHLVPEAHLWPKHESLLHTGMITEVEVPIEQLFEAFELRQLSSGDSLAILEQLGLADGIERHGPHGSPRKPAAKAPRKRAQKDPVPDRKTGAGTLRRREQPVEAQKPPRTRKQAAKVPAQRVRAKKSTTGNKRMGTAVKVHQREEIE